jgi:hypothetical protein
MSGISLLIHCFGFMFSYLEGKETEEESKKGKFDWRGNSSLLKKI